MLWSFFDLPRGLYTAGDVATGNDAQQLGIAKFALAQIGIEVNRLHIYPAAVHAYRAYPPVSRTAKKFRQSSFSRVSIFDYRQGEYTG
jgi:hypothetical protein